MQQCVARWFTIDILLSVLNVRFENFEYSADLETSSCIDLNSCRLFEISVFFRDLLLLFIAIVFNRLHRSEKYAGALGQHFQASGRWGPSPVRWGLQLGRAEARGAPSIWSQTAFIFSWFRTRFWTLQRWHIGLARLQASAVRERSLSTAGLEVLSQSPSILFIAVQSIENHGNEEKQEIRKKRLIFQIANNYWGTKFPNMHYMQICI